MSAPQQILGPKSSPRFKGLTLGTSVLVSWSVDTLHFDDLAYAEFGTGGLTGALGCDGVLWSSGTNFRAQIESNSKTGFFSGSNPLIAFRPFNIKLGGADDWVIAQDFGQIGLDIGSGTDTTAGGASFADGISVLSHYLYIQDIDGVKDGRLVIPKVGFPTTAEYFELFFDSTNSLVRMHTTAGTAMPIVIQEGSSSRGVGFHTATPTQSVDFNADTRHRSSEEARFGGTTSSDHRGLVYWTGTLFAVMGGRHPTADTAGGATTVQGGGATSAATNKAGGDLNLSSGISTGNGQSDVVILTVRPTQGTGTTDRTPAESARFTDGGLRLTQAVVGSIIHQEIHTATNDDPTLNRRGGRTTTTNTTLTTLVTIATTSNKCILIEATIIGRRTGGSAGVAGASCAYKIVGLFNNISGTVTQIGTTGALFTAEDNAACAVAFTISGTNVLVQVQGDTDNNYTWHTAKCETQELGT